MIKYQPKYVAVRSKKETNIHVYPTRISGYLLCNHLELENLLLVVAELLQDTLELTLVLGADLGTGDGLVHGRRTTDEELDVVFLGLGEDSLQQLLGDVALAASPFLGGLVQDVEGLEALGVGVLKLLELLLEEDVLLRDVAEHEGHLRLVLGVLEDMAGKLVHGGDTSATGDQADVVMLVGLPGVLDDRTLHRQSLVNVEGVDVLGHGAIGVGLDNELEVSGNF